MVSVLVPLLVSASMVQFKPFFIDLFWHRGSQETDAASYLPQFHIKSFPILTILAAVTILFCIACNFGK